MLSSLAVTVLLAHPPLWGRASALQTGPSALQQRVSGEPPAAQARETSPLQQTRSAAVSPLQVLVDRAAPGERILVSPGTYQGDLVIDRPVRLVGRGRPLLVGSGTGSVVRVRADGVTLEGFSIDGRATSTRSWTRPDA